MIYVTLCCKVQFKYLEMKQRMIITGGKRRLLGTLSIISELCSKHACVKNKLYGAVILLGECNEAVCRRGSCAYLRQSRTRVFLTALRPFTLDPDRKQV